MSKFWETTALADMTQEQWESLCDGCGKCCLNKLATDDDDEYVFTRIACKLLDPQTCQCSNYPQRFKYVRDCEQLTPQNLKNLNWLPNTCAYRLIDEGQPLPEWHHLISGDRQTIHDADMSVQNAVISEEFVHEDGWQEHIIQWVSN